MSKIARINNLTSIVFKPKILQSNKISDRIWTAASDLVEIKGVNKTLAYKMNEIAVNVEEGLNNFDKASQKDLKRLTSVTLKDSYNRAKYVDPNTNKVFYLLKEKVSGDNLILRVLDKDGAFVKNVETKTKNICIVDDFVNVHQSKIGLSMTHGKMVSIFAKRYNPFAKIIKMNADLRMNSRQAYIENINSLFETILKSDKKVDYISVSSGNSTFLPKDFNGFNELDLFIKKRANKFYDDNEYKRFIKNVELLNEKGVTIFSSAGNSLSKSISLPFIGNVNNVGCLSSDGKIALLSALRHPHYTQHYERGIFDVYETPYGLNITGEQNCTDIKRKFPKLLEKILKKYEIPADKKVQEYGIDWTFDKKINSIKACEVINGTSFSTPIRTAKVSLYDMMKDVL